MDHGREIRSGFGLSQEVSEVEGARDHGEFASRCFGPLGLGFVPVEFDAVLVGVAKVESLAHAVVGCAVEWNLGGQETAEGVSEVGAGRVEDRRVIKAGVPGRGRGGAEAFPRVESDVVMIPAGGDKRSLRAVALHQLEAEDAAVEAERAVEISDLQVHMADPGAGSDG